MNLSAVFVLAGCAAREHTRRHLLHVVVLLSLGAIGFAVGMSLLGGEAHTKILKDLATASLLFFGGALAVVLSVVSVGPEIEARTILPVLARPIRRGEYLVGRYLGTLATVGVALGIMAAAFAAALLVLEGPNGIGGAFALVLVFVAAEVAVLAAVGTTLGVFCPPPLAAVFAFFVFFAGSVKLGYGASLGAKLSGPAHWLFAVLTRPLPNLEAFDFRDALVHGASVPPAYFVQVAVYALLYVAATLSVGCWKFGSREL